MNKERKDEGKPGAYEWFTFALVVAVSIGWTLAIALGGGFAF